MRQRLAAAAMSYVMLRVACVATDAYLVTDVATRDAGPSGASAD